MSVYAIGDIQGCYSELQALLDEIRFEPQHDLLWFAGDLVNRGPHSLEVVRFVKALGERAITVLGNHDLHLLATSEGIRRKSKDTFGDILSAPDRDELLAWLRHRPLLHRDEEFGFTMVHAGLPPQWSVADAEHYSNELATVLEGPEFGAFLKNMYGDQPALWSERLHGWDRLRFITNALTRMRYCDPRGAIVIEPTGPPETVGADLSPWYSVPDRRSAGERIIFGHWATLQMHRPLDPAHGVYHLDTGCVWGGRLTALRLDDERFFSVPCGR